MNLLNLRSFIGPIILFLTVIALVFCSNFDQGELPPPNIVWLISEDNSPFLGCYGDEFATSPNIDKLAEKSVKFINAFANAPVCAPARSTLISGMYATSMGTHHMRSENPTPEFMKFFPYYLKKAGYYTTNRVKKDYNTIDQDSVWDNTKWWGWSDALKGREKDQPFFMMYNTGMSHESKIHPTSNNKKYFKGVMTAHEVDSIQSEKWWNEANHNPDEVTIPPYHPETDLMKRDWAKYYDCIELMDHEIGVILQKLKEDGLLENTIIFYFSDHGGVLGRSKRFVYDSGLKVPFLLHVPRKYRHLFDYEMGTETDRVVSFIDFAPTVLSLANIELPDYLEGNSFAGHSIGHDVEYAFGFRGRMDERYDMVRTVRSKEFRYIRNYMPHRIYGGKVNYLWLAESMQSWQNEYIKGNLNDVQSAFWKYKPAEELYQISDDPHNVKNLAGDPKYQSVLEELRSANNANILKRKDVGFFPEAEMIRRYGESTPYTLIRNENIPFKLILETANLATEGKYENLEILKTRLSHPEPVVRYWGATGCAILKEKSSSIINNLKSLLEDESPSVRTVAAEAVFNLGFKSQAIETLIDILSLPKFEKNNDLNEVKLYSNQFAIARALNTIDALNIDHPKIKIIVKQIADSERARKRDYDRRIAQHLVNKFKL